MVQTDSGDKNQNGQKLFQKVIVWEFSGFFSGIFKYFCENNSESLIKVERTLQKYYYEPYHLVALFQRKKNPIYLSDCVQWKMELKLVMCKMEKKWRKKKSACVLCVFHYKSQQKRCNEYVISWCSLASPKAGKSKQKAHTKEWKRF